MASSRTKKSPMDVLDSTESGTPASVKSLADKAMRNAEAQDRRNLQALRTEEQISVSLAPMYAPYFGDVMTVTLNGLSIYLPINGRSYKVPRSYARIVHKRRRLVDATVARRAKLSNVTQNVESYAGELQLIPR